MTENTTGSAAFELLGDWSGQLVATAIHTGHDLRPEVADAMILDEQTGSARKTPSPT